MIFGKHWKKHTNKIETESQSKWISEQQQQQINKQNEIFPFENSSISQYLSIFFWTLESKIVLVIYWCYQQYRLS